MAGSWNSRYVMYAKVHGNTPDEQLESDKKEYPGGCMVGYGLWIDSMWKEFAADHGIKGECYWMQAEFDQWLSEKYSTDNITSEATT